MADDNTETESTPVPEPAKSGGAMRLVSAAMISIALVTTGYFLGGRGTAAAPPTETTEVEEEEEHAVGTIVDLDAVNVNLLDGHYLRIAVSLGLSEDAHVGDGHGGEEFLSAPARDLVVTTFSGRSIDELSNLDGRLHVRHELEESLKEYYHGEVVSVFFTEFVMQ
jgi:flagellar FliL protein